MTRSSFGRYAILRLLQSMGVLSKVVEKNLEEVEK
jgi:hypothetical protein